MNLFAICPCGSQQVQAECCKRYHDGEVPENAERLMRSRFAAYAYNLPDYIISTTHDSSPQRKGSRAKWRAEIVEFSKTTKFEGLQVLEFIDGDKTATVTFKATLTHDGRDVSFSEKSTFLKENGRWYYKSGQILKEPVIRPANPSSRL